jgi:predicted extracellular nuclease
VAISHINANEPRLLDYNEEYKSAGQLVSLYSEGAYRSSDRDPVIAGLELGSVPAVQIFLPLLQRQ